MILVNLPIRDGGRGGSCWQSTGPPI